MGLKKGFKDTWPGASARAIKFMGAIITALTVWRLVNLRIKGPWVQKGSHVRTRLRAARTHPQPKRRPDGGPLPRPAPRPLARCPPGGATYRRSRGSSSSRDAEFVHHFSFKDLEPSYIAVDGGADES